VVLNEKTIYARQKGFRRDEPKNYTNISKEYREKLKDVI